MIHIAIWWSFIRWSSNEKSQDFSSDNLRWVRVEYEHLSSSFKPWSVVCKWRKWTDEDTKRIKRKCCRRWTSGKTSAWDGHEWFLWWHLLQVGQIQNWYIHICSISISMCLVLICIREEKTDNVFKYMSQTSSILNCLPKMWRKTCFSWVKITNWESCWCKQKDKFQSCLCLIQRH